MSKSGIENDLGVTVTELFVSQPGSSQCAKVAKKAFQRLGLLRRGFKHIFINSFKVIHIQHNVRP
jgi:hypothetical protein